MLDPKMTAQAISSCNSGQCLPLSFLKPKPSNVLVAAIRLHIPRSAYYGTCHQFSVIHQSRQIWIADYHELPEIIIPSTRRYDLCPTMFQEFRAKNGEFGLLFDCEFTPGLRT
jgi:hypothetical protein